jgi:hypothetical protein
MVFHFRNWWKAKKIKAIKHLLTLTLAFVLQFAVAQTYEYKYLNPADSSTNCYVKVIPESETVKALIVRDFSRLPNISKPSRSQLHLLAAEEGIMTVFTVTSKYYPDLYLDDNGPALLEKIILEIIDEHGIPPENIFIGGISASGARAFRFAQYCQRTKDSKVKVKGVFGVDPPLDLVRLYNSSEKTINKNHPKGNLEEARLICSTLEEHLGGKADDIPEVYQAASVYSPNSDKGGNAALITNIPIILFHEPDLDWWQVERGEGFDHINSVDIIGMIENLEKSGHQDIQLITTTGKGFDRNGNRKPHSWTIVDEVMLLDWILDRLY